MVLKDSQEYPVNVGVLKESPFLVQHFPVNINDLISCDQASDLWQRLELATGLPIKKTLKWGLLISLLEKLN